MRIKAGSLALITGTACAGGMKQSALASELNAMNVSRIFMDYMDFARFIDPGIFRDTFNQDLIETLEATKILAVPGSEMGVGLPALIALGIYAWAQLRGMYHRNVLDPEPHLRTTS